MQWVWPSAVSYSERHAALVDFTELLAAAWTEPVESGHPLEVGHSFLEQQLPRLWQAFNAGRPGHEPMPWLAALVCCSPFDIALHDAYGNLLGLPVYQTYGPEHMNRDLEAFLEPPPAARSASPAAIRAISSKRTRLAACLPGIWWAGSTHSTRTS